MKSTTFYGRDVEVTVGKAVELDSGRVELLLPCDWDKAEFRFPDPIWRDERGIACNVKITGRKPRHRGGRVWARVKITWVGDGEPDTTTGGWLLCF